MAELGNAHPLLIVGIVIFVLPFLNNLPGLHWIPQWFRSIGVIIILIGSGLSIYNLTRR